MYEIEAKIIRVATILLISRMIMAGKIRKYQTKLTKMDIKKSAMGIRHPSMEE